MLNHSRFPAFRKYRRSARCPRAALVLAYASRLLWAVGPSAHRARASFRRTHGFAALANIGVLRAGRAQPLYLLTPAGRFALRATAHRADASLRCASGRFWPSAQQPTGLALPFAPCRGLGQRPKSCAAAQNASVSSGRRSQETRMDAVSMFLI